ncbi:MAG: pyridoxamine 5'-phosphate oxidase family protein [Roseomonas sp.]|nr:pyridoxamine 5'-phosphate oxidase family protein [Roseomonas sp.]MCA3304768.1 pyridoxamine 5'-phosphate oxidase family protein [Roseomonas sp.]
MEHYDAILEARRLIRAGRAASLATGQAGQPFASLVTPASAPDLSPLMLLSSLSEHTRHLQADPRCALLITGAPTGPNPQTAPRVTVTGMAEQVPAEEVAALKARWLSVHPYAALYADFGDFALWRVRIGGALLVGGFARAVRIKASALAPDEAAVAAVAAAEAEIIGHVNEDHADAVAAIATGLLGGAPGPWRLVAVDPDGCDISDGGESRRLAFPAPLGDADAVRMALIRAAREGRAALAGEASASP